ncbi:MAG TPA: type II toxin-antitoxin system VapC family toxin [Anaerolineales bacterium]|nr:type II toxin-antitoxin system VapC family toxin [Anaerolineales bacterium]
MMLADSNLIIYAASGKHPELVDWFLKNELTVSAVSLVETLGYHKLNRREKTALDTIYSTMVILYPSPEEFQTAIQLRQQRAMSLGDALIAATAINNNLTLATHNPKDFSWIKSLGVLDPMGT